MEGIERKSYSAAVIEGVRKRARVVVYGGISILKFGKILGFILIGRNLKWSVLIGRALFTARGATV